MQIKSSAIDRLLRENPRLQERRFGLPYIGGRNDNEGFNPTVQNIADAIDFYGYAVRDANIATIPDIDLGNGNPMKYEPFPLSIEEMKKALDSANMYKYPYTEGDDNIRKSLLDYVEQEGFINSSPYSYEDIDEKGLSIHNITFTPSTSIAFNIIVNIISKPGDVILITGPNYGLFTIRAERSGADVEIIKLEKEDNWLINPDKLAAKIDSINDSLQNVYNRRKGYVPRVVAFLNANPNNPTGKVMGEKEIEILKGIGEVCQTRGVFVIDDLVYRDLTYDDNNIAKPIASIPGMFRNTISLLGLSKSYGMASLRAGFIVADEIIIREVINRIFQEIDSSPDIVGRALTGAFNTSERRNTIYKEYFSKLKQAYIYKYNLLKTLVSGIQSIEDDSLRLKIKNEISTIIQDEAILNNVLNGLPYVSFPTNLVPESGFFAILDFSKIRGMKFDGQIINSEKDLLKFFYKTARTRFLVGQSISWPYENELIGRVTYALEDEKLITAFTNMNKAIHLLEKADDYIIRKNEIQDQEQIAKIHLDSLKSIHDLVVSSKFANKLSHKEQTNKYINEFEEYKDLVLVAAKNNEILGYSYFNINDNAKYKAELVSLHVKESAVDMGIGTSLLKETAKELQSKGIKSMITWCFKEDLKSTAFYQSLGGICVEFKKITIEEEEYQECGFLFDLEKVIESK